MNRVALLINITSVIGLFAAGLALAACTATPPGDQVAAGTTTSASPAATTAAATPPSQLRELTPEEKKLIVDVVATALRDPGSAKYKWTKFPMVPPSDQVSYCATVDAKSPYAAYSGNQAFIVDTKVSGGHITAASLGLITGGKDIPIVAKMCKEHGLSPNG
jgi:hypothetical protein